MMDTIRVEQDGRGVATVTLSLPEAHNAMSAAMMDELTSFAAAPEARVVVLTGAGKSFCAGGDLRWMRAQFDADAAGRAVEGRRLAYMLKALNEMPVPLVARVNGAAFGGGVGLACVADVAVGV
ncbi:MAG: enoyl-CoA hydratase-related protein, partial [Pseudomonadota bacterium]